MLNHFRTKYGMGDDGDFDRLERRICEAFRKGMTRYFVLLTVVFLERKLGTKQRVAEYLGYADHTGLSHAISAGSLSLNKIVPVWMLHGIEILTGVDPRKGPLDLKTYEARKNAAIEAGYTEAVIECRRTVTGSMASLSEAQVSLLLSRVKQKQPAPPELVEWVEHVIMCLWCIPQYEV